ncbi:unnamed protein product [Urochloa decumbens]|uniref:Uncharacterized protein n=1 Tax=Urochloa decumbens TaxID=240449 RepID=A0ABC8ZZQ1_9POAL
MAESAVASVLRPLGTVAAEEFAFLRGVHANADRLRDQLRRILRDADAKRRAGGRNSETITNWVVDVREAAYDAENALEKADLLNRRRGRRRGFTGVLPWCADLAALHSFGKEIVRVQTKIRDIIDSAAANGIVDPGPGKTSMPTYSAEDHEVTCYDDDSFVVGLDQERSKIIEELTDENIVQISVVSIVGMGGSGKSTLARTIYKDSRIKQHFDALCWLGVPQEYRFLDLIKGIAKRIIMDIPREKIKDGEGTSMDGEMKDQLTVEALEKMNDVEVSELVRKELQHRRFLVVLDGVWPVWEGNSNSYIDIERIIRVFPDLNNGSRIMLTTRDHNVANHVNKRNSIHSMEFLDEKKSWELLEKKAMQPYQNVSSCDRSRLTPIGKKLAVKCKGLPLALVVLGGYLSMNLDYDVWSGLVDNLDWEAREKDEPIWKILEKSYNDLPNHHLRYCFLHLASFPEGYIIRIKRLIKLWVAEGFIPERPNRTMEDTAREYINKLAQKCILQVVDRSKVDGSIKSVALHVILRDWCIKEARRDGLFNIWRNTRGPEVVHYSSDSIPTYRVAVHNFSDSGQNVASNPIPNLRTIWLFGLLPMPLDLPRWKFLRVVDLYGIKDLERLPPGIGKLLHLRYLGLPNDGHRSIAIPSSVSDLLNLQTLDARNSRTTSLPRYFWDVPTFRHIYLTDVYKWFAPKVGCLTSLQTLHFSGVCVLEDIEKCVRSRQRDNARARNRCAVANNRRKWAAMIEALSGMEQLVFLHLESLYSVGGLREMAMFPQRLIKVLSGNSRLRIRVLELSGRCHTRMPINHFTKLPCTLRKLKLKASRLPADPMPVLGGLPNLVVLTLEDAVYQGEDITCKENGFPRLQYLTFNCFRHVKAWNVEVGAFPRLIQLNLVKSFDEITTPPQGLLHVPSLKELQMLSRAKFKDNVSEANIQSLRGRGCEVKINYTDDMF